MSVLNVSWFRSMADARNTVERWRNHYNANRPHSALGNQTPNAFAGALSFALSSVDTAVGPAREGCPEGSLSSALTRAPAKTETHRALDDIRESIAELAYYRSTIFAGSAG